MTEKAMRWADMDMNERSAALRNLLIDRDMNYKRAAASLGITRSAVAGAAQRYKIRRPKATPKPREKKPRRPKSKSVFQGAIVEEVDDRPPDPLYTADPKAWEPLPDTTPVPVVDHLPGMCRWPVSDGPPWVFCGLPVHNDKTPYCKAHRTRGVRPRDENNVRGKRTARV